WNFLLLQNPLNLLFQRFRDGIAGNKAIPPGEMIGNKQYRTTLVFRSAFSLAFQFAFNVDAAKVPV
ncbi:MAG: hypothetical protein ACLFS0_09735, partial [Bacteroidales bacterium]